jgi:hypothetical protein
MPILALAGPEVGLARHVLFGVGGETSISPAILGATILAVVLMLCLPRKYVVAPLLLLSIPLPLGQYFMIGAFHFQISRILLLFAVLRLLWQRSREGASSRIRLNAVDKAVIGYTLACVVCYTLLWQQSSAFFTQVGSMYNILGFYFVFRFFLRGQEDVDRVIKVMVVVALIIGACMLNEQITGRNVLAMFGGVPEFTALRDGYLRSQGSFRVYFTGGAFGATLIPLFLCRWRKGGSRVLAGLGMSAALTITIASRTSTAISACLATAIGMGMWYARDKMRAVRWGLVSVLVSLHLVMKGPVWALLARIDLVGGSTGWHRFKIIDNCVHHFWDWMLFGSNNYWTWDGGDDMWDLANQYVSVAETTGLLSLIFFIATIVYCFKYLGRARKAARNDYRQAWCLWLLGVAMFSNLIAFLGISYFDQTSIYWYLLLAMIVTATRTRPSVSAVRTVPESSRREPDTWQAQPTAPEPVLRSLLLE